MANKKGLFGVLNDGAGAGVGIDNANPGTTLGTAITNTVASPAFVDSSGVLTFPALDANGAVQVAPAAAICSDDYAKVTGSTSFQDLGSVAPALEKDFHKFSVHVAAMTEACIQLVRVDDVGVADTETVLAEFMVGPGQYSYCCNMPCLSATTVGGTGTQAIKLQGKLLEATGAEIAGWLGFEEVP